MLRNFRAVAWQTITVNGALIAGAMAEKGFITLGIWRAQIDK
jgi:hypothetical protein